MIEGQNSIVLFPKRKGQIITLVVFSLIIPYVFWIGSVFALPDANPDAGPTISIIIQFLKIFRVLIFGFVVLFAGFMAFMALIALVRHTPAVKIDDEGIIVYGSALALPPRQMEWDQVYGIQERKVAMTMVVLLFLKNPEGFLSSQTGWSKFQAKLSYRMNGTPIILPSQYENMAADNVLELINSFLNKANTK